MFNPWRPTHTHTHKHTHNACISPGRVCSATKQILGGNPSLWQPDAPQPERCTCRLPRDISAICWTFSSTGVREPQMTRARPPGPSSPPGSFRWSSRLHHFADCLFSLQIQLTRRLLTKPVQSYLDSGVRLYTHIYSDTVWLIRCIAIYQCVCLNLCTCVTITCVCPCMRVKTRTSSAITHQRT